MDVDALARENSKQKPEGDTLSSHVAQKHTHGAATFAALRRIQRGVVAGTAGKHVLRLYC